jgi:hypothetical protein
MDAIGYLAKEHQWLGIRDKPLFKIEQKQN